MTLERPPTSGRFWLGVSDTDLPLEESSQWLVMDHCGAMTVFTGTARDHSDGRPDVSRLEYEAYEAQAVPRLRQIAEVAVDRWPTIGRMVLLHRVGLVPLGHAAVVVGCSSPHRDASFKAARFGIEALKKTVPIWKTEEWAEGKSWGLEPQHIVSLDEFLDTYELDG